MDETIAKLYEQVNENWRFLAKWRQLAFAGYLAVLAGAISFINFATEHAYSRRVIGGCFLFLAGICFIFWITDRRTHRLTMHACRAGVELEETKPGFFRVNAKLDQEDRVLHSGRRGWRLDSHSLAALLLFVGSMLVFGIAGLVLMLAPSNWGELGPDKQYVIRTHTVIPASDGEPAADEYTISYDVEILKVRYSQSQTSSAKKGDTPGSGLHWHTRYSTPDLSQVPPVGVPIRACLMNEARDKDGDLVIAEQATSEPCMARIGNSLRYEPSPNGPTLFAFVSFEILSETAQ